MSGLTIGKVAKKAGVGVETVRFYERLGLIEQPPRIDGGYRKYPEEAVNRIRFIRRAKKLGFTLKEISELLMLQKSAGVCCSDFQRRAESKRNDIVKRIEELEKMRDVLDTLIKSCSLEKSTEKCPILDVMQGEDAK